MLELRFGDIDWGRKLIVLRGVTTKSRKTHPVPIATTRLHAVLKWLQLDAAGQEKPAEALVFSDESGEGVGRFRTAWVTAVLKSHDVKPEWKACGWTALTPECAEQFRRINLHWHNLRHEYASRLVEKGVPLAQVRDLLGHASITTTERYDNQKLENLQAAAAKLESGKSFDATPHGSESRTECQVFVKNSTEKPPSDDPSGGSKTGAKSLDAQELPDWLGGRDSNPDTVVQSHVSYRWTTSQYPPTRAMMPGLLIIANPKADRKHARRLVPGGGDHHLSSFANICGSPAFSTGLPGASLPSCLRRWLAIPPLRPASRASSDVHSCALPF
jgi:Phage integrase family